MCYVQLQASNSPKTKQSLVTSQQQSQNKTIFKNRSHHVVMCCVQLQARNSPKTKRSLRTGHTMCMLDESLYAESGCSYFDLLLLVPDTFAWMLHCAVRKPSYFTDKTCFQYLPSMKIMTMTRKTTAQQTFWIQC